MASVPAAHVPPHVHEKIHSPLHKLRGAIRRYIVVEAVGAFIVFVALTYWLGTGLDYFTFWLTGIDFVQVFPKWVRLIILLALAGGIGTVMLLKLIRLAREFRPEALALLLERRFPKLLGDRLITAVELSRDLDESERLGYSRALIVETVNEVTGRVGQVPVARVFNWRRLIRHWLFAAFVTFGVLALVFAGDQAYHRRLDTTAFGHRLADVSAIWFERNFLLMNTPWPRRAHLVVVEFPESGELRIGRDAPSPRLKVRALKWVVADRAAPDGWRAMVWADLPRLVAATPELPAVVRDRLADPAAPLDEVEFLLTGDPKVRAEIAAGISGDELLALERVYDGIDERAADPRYSRTLRKLRVPDAVTIRAWGKKTRSDTPMTRQQTPFEFVAVLTDLKESVKFNARGEDYVTHPDRRITLVPPPVLQQLLRDEYVPAYYYHRPPADDAVALKGQRQTRTGVHTSLTGSTSRVDLPTGSDVVFRGEVDKPLAEVRVRYRTAGQKPGDTGGRVETVPVGADGKTFEKRFDTITRAVEFDFEFTDTDNVKSIRRMVLQPADDRTPDVDVTVEVIRKTNQGFMCTPEAFIPFSGRVRDDVGLAKIEYSLSYSRVESAQQLGVRAAIAAGVIGTIPVSPQPIELIGAAAIVDHIGRYSESREGVTPVPPIMLPTFAERAGEKDREFRYGKAELAERLQRDPPVGALVKDFELKPNLEFLDLREKLEALSKSQGETIRPRYKMRLTVTATDNNIETGPRTGQNKETFTFLVVPYEELLGEMAKDEEVIGSKMTDLVAKMDEVRHGIRKVLERMPTQAGSDEFRASASRMVELEELVIKGKDTLQEVFGDYGRLLNESKTNRLPAKMIADRETINNRLDEALRALFPRAEEAHATFRKALEGRSAPTTPQIDESRQRQDELVEHLKYTLALMGQLEIMSRLPIRLAALAQKQAEILEMTRAVKQDQEDLLVDQLGQLEPKFEPVEVLRGEKKIVTVELGRGVKEDRADQLVGRLRVVVKAAPDGAVIAPPTVVVPRLVDRLQFEITGGDKAGDFTLELVPQNVDGKAVPIKDVKGPLVVKVKVK